MTSDRIRAAEQILRVTYVPVLRGSEAVRNT